MRIHHSLIALSLIAALSARSTGQGKSPDSKASQKPALSKAADPMANFVRLVPGEWRVAFQSGPMFHTWHWGPGKHSVRVITDGTGGAGEPWRALGV